MTKLDLVDLIIERVKHYPITSHLEQQEFVPKFKEFNYGGRNFLATYCPFNKPQELPLFWVYEKANVQFFYCDDCHSQGSILDFFQIGYSMDQIRKFLDLDETPSLEESLEQARQIISSRSDEASLPTITGNDFVKYDCDNKKWYIGWFPYPESPVYQKLKGKILTDLQQSVIDLGRLEENDLIRSTSPE